MPSFTKLLPRVLLGAAFVLSSLTQAWAQLLPNSFASRRYAAVHTSSGARHEYYKWVDTDQDKNSYILTQIQGTGKFGDIAITVPRHPIAGVLYEYGLLKLDSTGKALWYRKITRFEDNQRGIYGASLHTDAQGNCYLAVTHTGKDTVGGIAFNLPNGRHAVTVTKYDANGNQLWANWAAQGNTPHPNEGAVYLWPGRSITVLSTGEIVVCGNMYREGTVYFHGATFPTKASRPFVVKTNSSGVTTKTLLSGNSRGNYGSAIASSGTNLYIAGLKQTDTLSFPATGGGTHSLIGREMGDVMYIAKLDAATLTVQGLEARREYRDPAPWNPTGQSRYSSFDLVARSDGGAYALGNFYCRDSITDFTGVKRTTSWSEGRIYNVFGAPALPYNGTIVRKTSALRSDSIPSGYGPVEVLVLYEPQGLDIQADNSLLIHGRCNVDADTALSFPINPQLDRLNNSGNGTITKLGAQGQYLGTMQSMTVGCISALPTPDRFVQIDDYQVSLWGLFPFYKIAEPSGAAGSNGYWARYGASPNRCNYSLLLSRDVASPGDEVEVLTYEVGPVYGFRLNGKPLAMTSRYYSSVSRHVYIVPPGATTGIVQPMMTDTTYCVNGALLKIAPPAEVRMGAAPRTLCGGLYTDPQGAGNPYSNNQYITQTLTPATAGAKLRLDFTRVALSDNDQLYVYNGPTAGSPLLFRSVGGSTAPGALVSTHATGTLTVRFYSNVAGTGEGFEAVASCLTDQGSMPTITGMSKTSGVNGDKITLTGSNLIGTLSVRFGKKDTEGFTVRNSQTVDVVVPVGAETDYIMLGATPDGVRYATAISPKVFTITDTVRQFAGQTAICSGVFTDPQGPSTNYLPNLYLTQTIKSSVGNRVALDFTQFDLAAGDQLYIYDGPTTAWPRLLNYRGGMGVPVPDTIRAKFGPLTIRFYSDGTQQGAGWMANIFCLPWGGNSPSPARLSDAGGDGLVETFAFWPNPARDKLTVRLENVKADALMLFNAQGQQVYSAPVGQGVSELALPRLAAGLYTVKVGRHTARLAVEQQ